jgi:hypothetical protein
MDLDDDQQLTPLVLTTDAALDRAVTAGWTAWREAASRRPVEVVERWLDHRAGELLEGGETAALAGALLGDDPPESRAVSLAEFAELVEEDDPELGTLLWETVTSAGRQTGDAELLFEGLRRLATIEEMYGDPLSAAEFYIDFLNWRRADDHASDPELVLMAFDEIVRLAEQDRAPAAAARFGFHQAQFMRMIEKESFETQVGDWARSEPVFLAWDAN